MSSVDGIERSSTDTQRLLDSFTGVISSSGDNLIRTPASGYRIRIKWLSVEPLAPVTFYFKWGTSGKIFYTFNIVTGGSIIMRDIKERFLQGLINELLYINLSAPVSTIWNLDLEEVDY